MNGLCACWSFYAGTDCKIPVQCAETCLDLCNTAGQERRCNSCIGMCESSAPRSSSVFGGPPLGVHNPFEDLQTTLLQSNKTGKKQASSEWLAMRKKQHVHHEVTQATKKKKKTHHAH